MRVSIDQADYESREVVVAQRIDAGHLSSLSAQEGAPSLAARLAHALDELREHVRVELAGGEVVEEEQRPCSDARDVVDAVVDDVDADPAVLARGDCDLDLRADPVGAGREVTPARQGVKARERADAGCDLLAVRRRDQRLHALESALVGLDVDACRGVRQSLAAHTLASCGAGVSNCILSISSCWGTGTG